MDSFLEQLFACYASNITTSNGGQAGSGRNNAALAMISGAPPDCRHSFLPASRLQEAGHVDGVAFCRPSGLPEQGISRIALTACQNDRLRYSIESPTAQHGIINEQSRTQNFPAGRILDS
jgi:hypothetical protein